MNNTEQLLLLFFDAFIASTMIPARIAYVQETLLFFNVFSRELLFIIPLLASILATFANIILGRIFRTIRKMENMPPEGDLMLWVENKIQPFLGALFVLLIASSPVYGSLSTVIAAFFKVHPFKIALAATLSYAVYYAQLLYF